MSNSDPVASFYGRWAGLYDVLARRTPRIGTVRNRVVAALDLDPGDTVVEMGCGTGANLPYLRERVGKAGRVIGFDLSPGMLAHAERHVRRQGWRNVHLGRADAARPPVGQPVDAVLGTFVIGIFDQPEAVVSAWCRLCTGRIALLDAVPSDRRGASLLNGLFRVGVVLSTPPTLRVRYPDPPITRLTDRVRTAHTGLGAHATAIDHEELAFGFLQLTAGTVE